MIEQVYPKILLNQEGIKYPIIPVKPAKDVESQAMKYQVVYPPPEKRSRKKKTNTSISNSAVRLIMEKPARESLLSARRAALIALTNKIANPIVETRTCQISRCVGMYSPGSSKNGTD